MKKAVSLIAASPRPKHDTTKIGKFFGSDMWFGTAPGAGARRSDLWFINQIFVKKIVVNKPPSKTTIISLKRGLLTTIFEFFAIISNFEAP